MPTPPRARRRFSQNFLVDGSAVRRIVDLLAPCPGEAILEIGPGHGALTGELVERSARLAAVEVDRDLAAGLLRRFGPERWRLHVGDVLDLPWDDVDPLLDLAPGERFALVGNLPYHVSKPIAMRAVDGHARISRAVLMFQREVAERLTARPGGREYGPLTVLVGAAFRVEIAMRLGPGAFRPRPKVDSAVTRWIPRPDPPAADQLDRLRRCLRACFASRRRTLRNNVRSALHGDEARAERRLREAGLDPEARAEQVDPEGFARLAALWDPETPG